MVALIQRVTGHRARRTGTCIEPNCTRPWKARRLCGKHYQQYAAQSRTFPPKLPVILRPPEERFWAIVDKDGPDGCWLWAGRTSRGGYGQFVPTDRGGKRDQPVGAHRYAWALLHGPIPDGLFVLHQCDNPSCVNPVHLHLGTHEENMAEMATRNRALTGANNPAARFSPLQARQVRTLLLRGVSQQRIAEAFDASLWTIRSLQKRQTYASDGPQFVAPDELPAHLQALLKPVASKRQKPRTCWCGKPAHGHGLCRKHHSEAEPRKRLTPQERFWSKVDKTGGPTACWTWTAWRRSPAGYGRFTLAKATHQAHRVAWAWTRGLNPADMDPEVFILHSCDNKGCVNPAHLRAGTHAENLQEAAARQLLRAGPAHTAAAFTADEVRAIRARHAHGESRDVLAAEFDVSHSTMRALLKGKTYRHVR
jgi:hypothetical protein